MDNMVLQKVWQQGQRLTVDDLSGCAFTGEDAAHTFEISGKNASGAVAISGTIAGKFLRSDNVTVPVTGTASDGVASITLTEDCYAVPGRFIFSVYANDGTHNICIYCGVGNVLRTDSGEYEGGEIITDVTALINAIETAVATIPADYSTLLSAIAPTFSASTAYAAGSYVWYDGNLYKFTADHAAGSWTGTDAVSVSLAGDLGAQVIDLKSAVGFTDNEIGLITNLNFVRGTIYQGKAVTTESFHRICMPEYVSYPYPVNISIASDYRFLLEWIDSSGTLTDENGNTCVGTAFIEGPYNNIPANTQFRLAIKKATETTGVLADITQYVSALTVTSRVDYIQSLIGNLESIGLKSIGSNVTSSNYATVLPSLDNAPLNTFIPLIFSNLSTSIPTNYPFTYYNGVTNILLTFARNSSGNVKTQIIITQDSILMRYCPDGGTYTNWTTISKYTSTMKSMETNVTSGNYQTVMPDMNDAPSNSIYQLIFAPNSTSIPAHYPFTAYRNTVSFLMTFSRNGYNNNEIRTQLLFTDDCLMMRWCVAAGTWQSWTTIADLSITKTQRRYTVDANGNGDYTSFVDCVKEAVKYRDSIVYVNQGDYDLVSEWGSTYLDNNTDDLGLMLGNGIHIIFSSNAKLIFNYEGSNTYILTEFAPFNAEWEGSYLDYTLENMTLECYNCRYGIHDELHGTATRATHKYLNCRIDFDNTDNQEWSGDCIGGGLGSNVEIIIKNCIFKCLNNWANSPSFSWHNAKVPVAQNAKSRIVIDGCYCYGTPGSKKGTFRFGWYGYSQKMTEIIICNNSFTLEPFFINETEGDSPYENAEFIKWNNEIRSN